MFVTLVSRVSARIDNRLNELSKDYNVQVVGTFSNGSAIGVMIDITQKDVRVVYGDAGIIGQYSEGPPVPDPSEITSGL